MRPRLGYFSVIIFFQVFFICHDFVATASHAPYTFNDLLAFVAKQGQKLHYGDVQTILKKLHFEDCTTSVRKQECNKCLSPKDLGLTNSSVLNSTQFNAKSMAIVYYLMPEKTSGNNSTPCALPSLPSKLFETLAHNFTHGKSSSITEHGLEHILSNVNKTLGPHLNKKKCFSAESIIEEVKKEESDHDHHHEHSGNETGLDEDDFQKACAIIVYRLIQGYCIAEHESHSNLPSSSFFIDDLFKTKNYLQEEDLLEITKKLGIAKEAQNEDVDDHGHSHKRRRRAVAEPTAAPTPHNATCFSLDSLLDVFSIDHSVGASKSSFTELCPALIQQVQSGSCTAKKSQTKSTVSDLSKVWGYGFLSVTIISLASLVGVATIPFVGRTMYKKVLALLVALAVGTLAGDATLHLIPHALGLHQHEEGEEEPHSEDISKSFLWKAAVILASIYFFYLFEVLMHFGLKNKHTHSHVDLELPGPSSRHMSYNKKKACSNFEHHEGTPQNLGNSDEKVPENGDIILTNVNARTEDKVDYEAQKKPPLSKKISSLKESLSRRSVFSDENQDKEKEGISTVAWMIIIGDTIHNISDGLAIGAAFSEGGASGISGGISTSIAVFCHELPHELGDFAVLLTAGMSVKKALFANFLSACSCYIGLVIGILVGQQIEMRLWIFAIAGGMFLYVALVDMLPDLMHSESLQTDTCITFLLQNIGLILGITIMLIIGYFEEALMAAVKI
ncbi:zinc transporter ZIP14-like isoform X2 [Actinia tenebrosa]|uniref:Zinc transporter ZIP14-like isoform X2 n=1 Tax=Actinia tenebrosa TaxID=6105 RepID=A0A6P8HK91_ACTTE|nr:zinc transporter ZIP14-like isoform X2 [Actinia tenebrosa]